MAKKGTRRTSILNRRASQRARLSYWGKRIGFGVVLVGLVAGGWTYAEKSGWAAREQIKLTQDFHDSMQDHGFAVLRLLVDGRENLSRERLKDVIGVRGGQSVFEPDLVSMQARLEALSWVKSAVVERHLPDTIYVRLEEREPMAVWQRKKTLAVVDKDGEILTHSNMSRFRHLLIIVGDDAPKYAPDLVALLEAEPEFGERVESAKWIGGRRWNLFLKNGVEVRLPEDDMGQAIKRLADAQREAKLMDREVQAIDLRDPMRIVVQTAPGKAEEYQASFKPDRNI